ncbi:MAG TPA: CHAD domain-containing protein [Terriglobales bacterium]|nr:CHAD domain-containing protein [Terriglobales bacterium]
MTPVEPSRHPNYLRKLRRLLREVSEQPLPERVHQLRTTIRRTETFLNSHDLSEKQDVKKLLQQLAKLRRRAGRVRDVDVQTLALRTVHIGRQEETKIRLLAELREQRSKQEKKLQAGIEDKFSPRMRERMRKVESVIAFAGESPQAAGKRSMLSPNRLWRAVQDLVLTAREAQPFTPRRLHQFRIQCKKTRYLAEMLPGTSELLQQLRTMQDSIGDWHDWLTLTQNAAKITGPVESELLAHLQNVTQAKFADAVRVCKRIVSELEAELIALKRAPENNTGLEKKKAAPDKNAPDKKKTTTENKKTPSAAGASADKQASPAAS